MNTASAIFNLEASDGTKTPITGSWENATLPGATWKSGIINIPDSFPDGKIIISARAERNFNSGSDFYNKALDFDGDGRSALNTEDRSVDFPPFFKIFSVGHGFDLIPQILVANPAKSRTAGIIARPLEILLLAKRYTAPYARSATASRLSQKNSTLTLLREAPASEEYPQAAKTIYPNFL